MKISDNCIKFVGSLEPKNNASDNSISATNLSLCQLDSENTNESVSIDKSFDDLFRRIKMYGCNCIIYYHDLKFYGPFIIDYLCNNKSFSLYCKKFNDGHCEINDTFYNLMPNNSYKYFVSKKGLWYSITIKYHNKILIIKDSMKLIPLDIEEMSKSFKTVHSKMNSHSGELDQDHIKCIVNNLLIIKESLNCMESMGCTSGTIGSCCMKNFEQGYSTLELSKMFPNLYKLNIDNIYGSSNTGEYIRNSYHGGWCYVVPEKHNKVYHNGCTLDRNSLYPYVMHSKSGHKYPIGEPTFFNGEIPDNVYGNDSKYYFVRIKCNFKLKDGMLPTVQIKSDPIYNPKVWLTSSATDRLPNYRPILTLTCTDYELLKEHYDITNLEILDGCYFDSDIGIFDKYIEKWANLKMISKGGMRQIAKLFLNNLYGKFATSPDSSYKVFYLNRFGAISSYDIESSDIKRVGYIAIGSAITSYGRKETIECAQANYNGPDNDGFIYADTDSISCNLDQSEIKNCKIDKTEIGCWKVETTYDYCKFIRQKTYIKHVIKENSEDVKPYVDIKCAGMTERVKNIFLHSVQQDVKDFSGYDEDEKNFILKERDLDDFREGIMIPGIMKMEMVKGGCKMVKSPYIIRDI